VPEFRWILLGLGMLLLGGIWWWGSRRPSQASGRPDLREPEPLGNFSSTLIGDDPQTLTLEPAGPAAGAFPGHPIVREPSVPPFEPLRISAQESASSDGELELPVMVEPAVDSQIVQIDDVQMLVESPSADPTASTASLAAPALTPPPTLPEPRPRTDTSGRFSRVKTPESRPEPARPVERQKIIAVRICAVADTPWDGTDLATALTGSDLVHGRYGVFHRLHTDGRSIFCVASLVEPGSFDPASMPEQRFPGISIFAVLPGPVEPLQTFEQLMATARQLAQDLSGMMQDEKGGPLSPQRAGSLREEVVRFQQLLQAEAAR
jgi:cell division protein ZipA